jgi:hypothetical protein
LKDAGSADAAVGAMRPDGTWAFHNTPTMIERTRHHSQGRYETLGEEGSTSLGTCVQQALPILHHAALTGRPDYVGASKKALDAMQRFRVPRGAQVWEVAQGVPDIRASALAVQAYHLGYEITGERRYLDEAVYWAYTGLPFLYSWHVPHNHRPAEVNTSPDRNHPQHTRIPVAELFIEPVREITPYACIPVLGTTFYVHSWFGNVVQWCGLEWAWHVIDLTRVVEDKLLRDVADGVVRSGLQQTFDREPWVGLYPDSWDLVTNTGAGALLSARLTLACLKAQGAVPNWASTWSRGVDLHGKRLLVNGFGTSTRCEVVDGDLVVSVDFTPGSRNELVVAHTSRPRSVTVKGKKAPHGDGIPGWRAVEESDVIVVSFVQGRSKPCTITLRW